MRIYPGNGLHGPQGRATSRTARSTPAARSRRSLGRRRRPRQPVPQGPKLTLFPGNGPGGLTDPRPLGLDLSPYDWVVGVSDVSLTGHADLIVRREGDRLPVVDPGQGTGFGRAASWARGWGSTTWPADRSKTLARSREASRGALGDVRRLEPLRVRRGTTRTTEPPRASGSAKEAIPGGEAGFASVRRRPPSVRRLPAAAARHSSPWVDARAARGRRRPAGPRRRTRPAATRPRRRRRARRRGSGSANRTPSGSSEQARTGRSSARSRPARRARPGRTRPRPPAVRRGRRPGRRSRRRRGTPGRASAWAGRGAGPGRARGRAPRPAARRSSPPSWRTSSPTARPARRSRRRRT